MRWRGWRRPGCSSGSAHHRRREPAGASGSTGTALVAKSPPDGNTWLLTFDNHAVNPVLLPNFPFDNQKDLEPVTLIGTAPYMVAPIPRSLQDACRRHRRCRRQPGKISYGSVGSGSIGHLAMVLLSKQAGINLTHVPYRGGGPAVNDALAGHVDLVNGSVALLTPHVAAGRLRGTDADRSRAQPVLPDSPPPSRAASPASILRLVGRLHRGAHASRPVDRFSKAFAETLSEPAIKSRIEGMQITMRLGGPDEQRKFLAEQMKLWGPVVREHGIKEGEVKAPRATITTRRGSATSP